MGLTSSASFAAFSVDQVSQIIGTAYASAVTTLREFISPTAHQLEPNNKAIRIVLQTARSLSVAGMNLDGGAFPKGVAPRYESFHVGTHAVAGAAQITTKEKNLSKAAGSLVDIEMETLNKIGAAMAEMDDVFAHMDDTGIIAGYATGASAAVVAGTQCTYTFAAAGDIVGASRLLAGMSVEVVSAAFARRVPPDTTKATQVISVNKELNQVVLENAPAAGVAGDRLMVPGLLAPDTANGFHHGLNTGTLTLTPAAAATPSPLTVSGPGSAFLGAPFRKGLPYFCLADPAAYYFTLLRGSIPTFKPTGYDASAAVLSPVHLMAWRLSMELKRNVPLTENGTYKAITHPATMVGVASAQYTANAAGAWQNAMVFIPSSANDVGQIKDSVPKGASMGDSPILCGIPFKSSPMWKRGHVGLFADPASRIKKVVAFGGEPQAYRVGNTDVFEGRDAFGNVRAMEFRYMTSDWDMCSEDPSGNGEITNLSVA